MLQNLTRGTILIVDDNPTNLEVLYGTLDGSGCEILVEMDGEGGIQQAKKHSPDLILLDVMMPGIDGFETCRRLKVDPQTREIPIIFITALLEIETKMKGLQLGAVDYITKPFYKEEVLTRVQIQLKMRRMSLELERKNQKLEQKTEELTHALNGLRTTQLQLVQSEKMSSLGQLVAGVAHEINNPANFIYGNLAYFEEYVKDMFALLEAYRQYCPDPNSSILELRDRLDVEFLVEDLPKMVDSMKSGVQRIRKIVTSLRNFSRLDESEFKAVNLHEGLDSSLVLLERRLHSPLAVSPIKVIKNYNDLPNIECYAGQMNQVFINLLNNAIDAVEEKVRKTSQPGQIAIATEVVDDDFIRIRIKDNGIGIDENIQKHIFDPFFTTKPVGKGTGLGLSLSYKIVTEAHGGRLYCKSQLGEGTEFIIEIPLGENAMRDRVA